MIEHITDMGNSGTSVRSSSLTPAPPRKSLQVSHGGRVIELANAAVLFSVHRKIDGLDNDSFKRNDSFLGQVTYYFVITYRSVIIYLD